MKVGSSSLNRRIISVKPLTEIIIAALLLAAVQQSQYANAQTFGSAKNLSNNAGNSDSEQIAISGSNVFVVWSDNSNGNTDIFLKKSDDGGSTFGPTKNLSNNVGGSVTPNIAVSGSNVYVSWMDFSPGNSDILFKKSSNNGNTFGSTLNLSNSPKESSHPQMTASGSNLYIVWAQSTDTGSEIYFKRSTDNGISFENTVNLSNTDGGSFFPKIASVSNFVYVTWLDTPFDEADQGTDIHFKRSINNGKTFGTDLNLSNNPTTYSSTVKISASGKNVFLLWDDDIPSSGISLSFRRSVDNGNSFDTVKQFTTNNLGLSGFDIRSTGSNVYVVWSQGQNGPEDIYFKKSNNEGVTFAPTKNLSKDQYSSRSPVMSIIGNIVRVVWTDNAFGTEDILYRQSMDAGATFESTKNLSNNSGNSAFPQIVSSSSAVYVVWTDDTNGNQDILFSKGATSPSSVTKNVEESK